jgi:hypothetical protein
MTGKDVRWAGVEVAISRQPDEPDEFRVVFERAGPHGKAKLATVYVEGGEEPTVTRFVRPTGATTSGPGRAEYERKAIAVVGNLAETSAWD